MMTCMLRSKVPSLAMAIGLMAGLFVLPSQDMRVSDGKLMVQNTGQYFGHIELADDDSALFQRSPTQHVSYHEVDKSQALRTAFAEMRAIKKASSGQRNFVFPMSDVSILTLDEMARKQADNPDLVQATEQGRVIMITCPDDQRLFKRSSPQSVDAVFDASVQSGKQETCFLIRS